MQFQRHLAVDSPSEFSKVFEEEITPVMELTATARYLSRLCLSLFGKRIGFLHKVHLSRILALVSINTIFFWLDSFLAEKDSLIMKNAFYRNSLLTLSSAGACSVKGEERLVLDFLLEIGTIWQIFGPVKESWNPHTRVFISHCWSGVTERYNSQPIK